MLKEDLSLLRCVDCLGDLRFIKFDLENNVIENGIIECVNCSRKYPIIDEVAVFFKKDSIKAYISKYEIKRLKELGYNDVLDSRKYRKYRTRKKENIGHA